MVLSYHSVDSFWLSWQLHSDLQLVGCFLVSGAWWLYLSGEQKYPTQSKDCSTICDLGDLTGLFYQWYEVRILFLTRVYGQVCEPVIDTDS